MAASFDPIEMILRASPIGVDERRALSAVCLQ
jgi:hypothetical protein